MTDGYWRLALPGVNILAGKWVFEEGIGRGVVPHGQLRYFLTKAAKLVDEGRV